MAGLISRTATALALTGALMATTSHQALAEDRVSISFVSFTQDITDLYGQVLRGMRHKLDEAGLQYDLATAAPAAPDDFAGMDRILADVATLAPDYAVIGGASFELIEDRIAAIEAAGTTTIVVDVLPSSLGREPKVSPLTWVAVDHRRMGTVGGTWIGEYYCGSDKDKVTIAMFYGPAASEISQNRMGGALEAIEATLGACGKSHEVVQEVYADFNRERAFNLMTSVATANPDLDLVIGANSNTALGVMDAMESIGRLGGNTQILGMGGQLDELAAICRGDIRAAGFRDARQMGIVTAEAILAHHKGDAAGVPEVTVADMPVVHDCESVFANVPMEMLELDGFRTNISAEMWAEHSGQ